jgi:hypothetical protein
MNCELYTLQIIIYNLHVELNFNVHTDDARDGGLVVLRALLHHLGH